MQCSGEKDVRTGLRHRGVRNVFESAKFFRQLIHSETKYSQEVARPTTDELTKISGERSQVTRLARTGKRLPKSTAKIVHERGRIRYGLEQTQRIRLA